MRASGLASTDGRHHDDLPDGRTLAYTEVGAPDGTVTFSFHGAPGSRLELVELEGAFAAAGVRVIAADRPGYGLIDGSVLGAERRELPGVGHVSLGQHLPELVAEITAR